MYIPIRVVVAAIAAVLCGSTLGQQSRAEPITTDPLVGQWEGNWNYSTGMDGYVETFHLDFAEKNGRLEERFVAIERKHVNFVPKAEISKQFTEKATIEKLPHRLETTRGLLRTSTEPPKYRWYADGYCWNVMIDVQQLSGLLN